MNQGTRALSIVVLVLGLLSASESFAQISSGYGLPRSKSGLFTLHAPNEDRADVHDSVQLGSKAYNVFWNEFEAPNIPSSAIDDVVCPAVDPNDPNDPHYVKVPANVTEKGVRGYHRYRCISLQKTQTFWNLMLEDRAHNIQSVAIIWGSPVQYRNTGCEGFVWNNEVLKLGCVPRDAAMNDFEDYINYLAYTYSGQNGSPKISQYFIWNEAGSGAWFDNTPIVPTHRELTIPEMTTWVSKYASMLASAHAAIQRHTSGVLMHAVIDGHWYHNTASGQVLQSYSGVVGGVSLGWNKVHIGSRTVLEGLWALVGLSIDWSIAIHPYGEPSAFDPTWMNFQNVPALVAYQNQKLIERGVTPALNRPQEAIFASEVNWPDANAVCRAHDISMGIPNIVGYTPFMSITNEHATPNASYPIFASTNPAIWKLRNDHHCCETQGLGCLPWQQIAAAGGSDVGIGADGSVWVTGTGGSIYRRTGSTWQTMPGAASRIDVGPDGSAWVVGGGGLIYHWVGSTWQHVPGLSALDIGVGANGAAWAIGTDNGIYRWTGSAWQQVGGAAMRIDVGPDGNPWVVNSGGSIFRWTGSTWEGIAGSAQDVGVGSDGSVFVTGGPPGSGNGGVYRLSGVSFLPVVGGGTQISAGPSGALWVVQANGAIFTR